MVNFINLDHSQTGYMFAIYDGRDFHLYLDEKGRRKEISILPTTQLTTHLKYWNGYDLGKRVDLMLGDAKNPDGIDLSFVGGEDGILDNIDTCLGVRVVINKRAYEHLLKLGEAVSTYGNTEDKVRVVIRNQITIL